MKNKPHSLKKAKERKMKNEGKLEAMVKKVDSLLIEFASLEVEALMERVPQYIIMVQAAVSKLMLDIGMNRQVVFSALPVSAAVLMALESPVREDLNDMEDPEPVFEALEKADPNKAYESFSEEEKFAVYVTGKLCVDFAELPDEDAVERDGAKFMTALIWALKNTEKQDVE